VPELPEVETVRRLLEKGLAGQTPQKVEIAEDDIVFGSAPRESYIEAFSNGSIRSVGRKGKYFWFETQDGPTVFAHLGMAGWVRQLGADSIRLKEHGNAPFEDDAGVPRFWKWILTNESGERFVMTDGRRFSRVWLGESPETDARVAALGPDCFLSPQPLDYWREHFKKRSIAIKTALMQQQFVSGIGNWIADEVLFHAEVAPSRPCKAIAVEEIERILSSLGEILNLAVEVGADSDKFPKEWMFHHRWGGGAGSDRIGPYSIVREEIGGRTTAWCPEKQK
jgi:formamidopyrimidine-DNA glycosylase